MSKRDLWIVGAVAAAIALGWWIMKKTNIVNVGAPVTGSLSVDQRSMADLIAHLADVAGYADHIPFLQGLALEESSLNPRAKSAANSYGLFQIYHASNWSWLRSIGYTNADVDRLYDPTFNTQMAIRIVQYFERKGFVFPDQADIYNVGETYWKNGTRNLDYRQKVIRYTAQFAGGE